MILGDALFAIELSEGVALTGTFPDGVWEREKKEQADFLPAVMTYEEAHRAIKRGQTSLIEEGIPAAISANAMNRFGWTLLMLTALEGNTKIGMILLDRGADVTSLNHFGESALSLAAHKGHLRFVQMLMSHGASSAVRPHGHDLESWLRMASGLSAAKIKALTEAMACCLKSYDTEEVRQEKGKKGR